MSIDKTGQWWTGTEAVDTKEYVVDLETEGHEVHETRLCKCKCGSDNFFLEADRDEGCARRTCASCSSQHFICDSGEYWNDAEPKRWQCTECGNEESNLGVGFSLYAADTGATVRDVRWISIANRCTRCGTLSSFVDWRVDYGSSHQLIDQV